MNLQTRADKLAQTIEERLGVRGQGLEAKLARAGRRLPRALRHDLEYIAAALRMEENPRLSRQIDWARIDRGFAAAEHHLRGIDPFERRKTLVINWLAGNAMNLLIVAGLAAALMAWRGFL